MSNSFTPLLGLVKQVTGENPDGVWGDTLNQGFMDLVDAAIAGRSDVDVSAGNVTLTTDIGTTNQSRAMMLIVGGTPGVPRNVIVPSTQKLYIVANESDDTVTVKTSIGAGVTLAVGDMLLMYTDQTLNNVIQIGSVGATITPAPVFTLPGQPGTILNSTLGLRFPALFESSQGSMTAINLPISASTVTVADTIYRWVKTDISGGTPDGSTYSPAPGQDWDVPVWIVEGGVLHECFCRFFADGLSIEFFKCDGSAWINPSVRSLPSGTSLYNTIYATV